MNLNIVVCDDDINMGSIATMAIKSVLQQKDIETNIINAIDKESLLNVLEKTSIDLIMLDICLGPVNGIDLAVEIKNKTPNIDIIFISNREDLVFQCFDAHPFGFVRKSHLMQDITTSITSYVVKKKESGENANLIIKVDGDSCKVRIDTIEYIESQGKSQFIHLSNKDKPMETRSSMEVFEDKLSDKRFIRAHKSFLVNARFIIRFKSDSLILESGAIIPINKHRIVDVRREYLAMESEFDSLVI